jgi:predicted DNA-binding protein (MmcQ/YjbR family)
MELNIESFRDYCLSLPFTDECTPFDDKTLVFKVAGKIFAMCDIFEFNAINLKCNPDYAIELRSQYEGIKPGYHSNKKHWNTVNLGLDVSDEMIWTLTQHSYQQVVLGLPKKVQIQISK